MEAWRVQLWMLCVLQTCKVYVDKALTACISSINKARAQCDGVMDALGDVYSHASGVLDRLNPDRWAPNLSLHERHARLNTQQKTYSSAFAYDYCYTSNSLLSFNNAKFPLKLYLHWVYIIAAYFNNNWKFNNKLFKTKSRLIVTRYTVSQNTYDIIRS